MAIVNDPPLCFRQIRLIDFKSDEPLHLVELRRDGGISDAKEGIQHGSDAGCSVQFDAPLG